jgi:hypothetical protein
MQLFKRVYIGILFTKKGSNVGVRIEKNGKVIEHSSKEFLSIEHTLSREAISLIDQLVNKYPYSYVGLLTTGLDQGVIPWCSEDKRAPRNSVSRCIDKLYQVYADPYALRKTREKCNDIGGVDFIFSPTTFIGYLMKEEKSDDVRGGLLLSDGIMTLAIFEGEKLLFWAAQTSEVQVSIEEAQQEADDFLDELDDLDDNMDEIMTDDLEFDMVKEIEEVDSAPTEVFDVPVVGNDEYEAVAHYIITFVQESLQKYYHEDEYDKKFVEQIILYGVESEMEGWLQEKVEHDTLISTQCSSLDIAKCLVDLVKVEALS